MPERGRGPLILLLLAAALTSSWWVWWRERAPASTAGSAPPRSDYVLHQFTLASYGPDGEVEFRIEAPYLEREPGGDALSVLAPDMQVRDGGGALWRLQAESAWVRGDGELVRLLGAVLLQSPDQVQHGPTRIATHDLDAWPRQQRIEGTAPVELSRPGLRLSAVGMQLDLAARQLRLPAQVRARYFPEPQTESADAPQS